MDSHLDMDAAGTDGMWRGRHGIGQRTVLGGGLARSAIPLLQLPLAQTAQAQATYDYRQRFVQLVGGGNGTIYAVQADGRLLWYRNKGWSTVTASWANNGSARQIGTGWAGSTG